MKADPLNAPLTDEEQRFAEQNHYLIGKYLKIRKLPLDEWYDVVIFRYLRSVKRWFAIPELRKHNFEIIAFYAMKSAISGELKKQERRIKTISLDEVIPGTEDCTYGDSVTYENLNFVQYVEKGGEDMQISYNVELPKRNGFRGGEKSDEVKAIEMFIGSAMKNMCFTYDTPDEAKRKCSSLQTYRRKQEHTEIYEVWRSDNQVFIVRVVPEQPVPVMAAGKKGGRK